MDFARSLRNPPSYSYIIFVIFLAILSPCAVSLSAAPSPSGGAAATWEYGVSFSDKIILYDDQWREVGRTGLEFSSISSIIYDEFQDRIYVNDMYTSENGRVFALDRNAAAPNSYVTAKGSIVQKIHDEEKIRGMAFDPVNRTLFWIDASIRRIYKMDLDKPIPEPRVLFEFDKETPHALSVDVCRRFLYWTTANQNTTTIERSSLLGEKRVVLSKDVLNEPVALEVDLFSDQLFWIDDRRGTHISIETADLYGNNRTVLYDGANRDLRSLIVTADHLFAVDFASECVYRLNKTANATLERLHVFDKAPKGIVKRSHFIQSHRDHPICQKVVEALTMREMKRQRENAREPTTTTTFPNHEAMGQVVHGSCFNGQSNDKGECECVPGYAGKSCELNLCYNFCLHGNCVLSSNGLPLCACEKGFEGERCEVNRCAGYCLNDGRCELQHNEPVCRCLDAFFGRHCEGINSQPEICRSYCETGTTFPNINWSLQDECHCGNSTAEPLCSVRTGPFGSQTFISVIILAVLLTIILIVVMVLGSIRRWYKPARPKIKKTYVVRKSIGTTPMTYRPTPTEQCEITIENCCNMQYCDTPCFDPKILVKDSNDKESPKEDKRDLLNNIVLDNNSDLF